MKSWSIGESNITNGEPSVDLVSEDGEIIAHFYKNTDAIIASAAPEMLETLRYLMTVFKYDEKDMKRVHEDIRKAMGV